MREEQGTEVKRALREGEGEEEVEEEGWHARGVGGEGILWGMPGESRGNGRAAQCACVELISSPSTLHPPRPPAPATPSPLLRVPGVLAAPEESTESRGIWPRCLFALSTPSVTPSRPSLRYSLALFSSLLFPPHLVTFFPLPLFPLFLFYYYYSAF